jgi:hypothetical protein
MGEVTKVDIAPPVPAGLPNAEALKEQARTGVTQVSSGNGERPTWLPEKFKSPEDLAKAYSELEKKQGSAKQAPEANKAPEGKPAGEPVKGTEGLKLPEVTPEQKTAEAAVTGAGLKMDELNAEFQKNGSLSEENLKKLEGVGITKQMVDIYIEGQKAIQDARLNDLHSVAGSADKFAEMHRWSAENLSDTEKVTLNRVIESGDHAAIKLAFQGIHGKWSAAGQNEPGRQLEGSRAGANEAQGYAHRDEILADMKTAKYKSSQAERDRVLAKIKASAKGVW